MDPKSRIELVREQKVFADATHLVDPAVNAFLTVQKIVNDTFRERKKFTQSDGLVYYTLENLLNRLGDQAEGMLTCFCTGCPAPAETIARTVVECSINFMFIVSANRKNRVFSYFRTYLREHEKRLDEWQRFATNENRGELGNQVLPTIAARREWLNGMSKFIETLALDGGCPPQAGNPDWPKQIVDRFKATNHIESYWTVYHRLSAATHGSAEDTIQWLVAMYFLLDSGSPEVLEKVSVETVCYSAMMVQIGICYYAEACASMCATYDQGDAVTRLRAVLSALEKSVAIISASAGVPHD